ncbi:MAG: PEGA domain-containing protein, partial [Myxococcota bacterium]|nr:PEGA domain-containing protein [Myxococcota bacterium]
ATFRLDGYEDASVSAVFPRNGATSARGTLTKVSERAAEPAYLRINATPWADVHVDGKNVGQTPIGSLEVTAGTHTVRLVCPPLGTETTKSVTVGAGETKSVSADLEE